MERASQGSISKRNDIIAGNLLLDKQTSRAQIEDYLNNQP
jgi:hypothetical protein